jgi:hypothetical protein
MRPCDTRRAIAATRGKFATLRQLALSNQFVNNHLVSGVLRSRPRTDYWDGEAMPVGRCLRSRSKEMLRC